MQGKLILAVWPYKKDYFIGVVLFTDLRKQLRKVIKANIARKNKKDAYKDAMELKKEILGI